MARQSITSWIITDDLNGEELSADEATIIKFGLDGVAYQLETSVIHAEELRGLLGPYIARASRDQNPPKSARVEADLQKVREWARSNGWSDLKARGRIPAEVRVAYDKAH